MAKVKEAREGLGLSRDELASASGLSISTIVKIETRQCRVRHETAELLAQTLGKDVNELFLPNELSERGRLPQTGSPKKATQASDKRVCSSCYLVTANGPACTNCGEPMQTT